MGAWGDALKEALHVVGEALREVGRFKDALPRFERAADEAKLADVHGRVDHDSLGCSLHLVGFCLSKQGQYQDAMPWYERAADEATLGDVHGRVDHDSLAVTLRAIASLQK